MGFGGRGHTHYQQQSQQQHHRPPENHYGTGRGNTGGRSRGSGGGRGRGRGGHGSGNGNGGSYLKESMLQDPWEQLIQQHLVPQGLLHPSQSTVNFRPVVATMNSDTSAMCDDRNNLEEIQIEEEEEVMNAALTGEVYDNNGGDNDASNKCDDDENDG